MSSGYRAVQWSPGKRRYDGVLAALLAGYLALFLGATFVLRPEITAETALIRALGTAAFLLLHVVLVIGPLARLDRRFLPLLWNRRHLGVTMFCCALAHGAFALVQFHALGDRSPLVSVLVSHGRWTSLSGFPFQPLGLAALAVLFVMAATSHDFWLAQLTAPVWKGLHLGVYLAYALLVGHVALGALQDERSLLPALLVGCGLAVVLGSHLAAAVRERRVDAAVAAARTDGLVEVCRVEEIPFGRARVVSLAGERVAVFRHEGGISALSNVCQHQNGPLGEGRIVDGCVTCPWHGYQYRPETGASPPPFTERVPTFRARVEGGRVLLDPRPLPPGTHVLPAPVDPATPRPADREAFFVGYLPLPATLGRFLRRTVAGVAVAFAVVALAAALGQRPLGGGIYEYGQESVVAGVLRAAPVPSLWVARPGRGRGGGPPLAVVPLVGPGKHGPDAAVMALAGRAVEATGSWIHRGGVALFEVARVATSPGGAAAGGPEDDARRPLGKVRLSGEIVDSKCYLGVMKPGDGKSHRACAVRCISGGAPAALVARGPEGDTAVLVLVTPAGRPLGRELLDLVAEPVEVDGEAVRLGDLDLLVTDRASIRRLAPGDPR